MKTFYFVVMGIGLALLAGCKTMQSAPVLADVEAAERARFAAFISADPTSMRPLLADDLVYCHSTGHCQTKDEVVASIASKEVAYRAMEVLDMQPRVVAGTVVNHGKLRLQVESGGKVQQFEVIYTDVYVKRAGRWQMVAWQSTRIS